jgi:hypothetical protein
MARGCPLDPPPELATIQAENPVSRVNLWDGSTPWLITRYDDARAVLSDPRTSVNATLPGYPNLSAAFAARRTASPSLPNLDNPQHSAMRRTLTAEFMVKKVDALRPYIQQVVNGLVDDMLAGPKPVEFVSTFAKSVPLTVICTMLGVPYADRDFFHDRVRLTMSRSTEPGISLAANGELLDYLSDLLDVKNARPQDDLLSTLAVDQLRTGAMTRRQLAELAMVLLIGGHETTGSMIALGTLTLLENPDQLAEIRAGDQKLVENAVEELLRYLTVAQNGRRRVATDDIELGEHRIHKGEGIIVAGDIANRDPAAFPAPDVLDIHRAARHHMAFSYGIHQCLGQSLARAELQTVWGTLFRRIPTLALAVPFEDLAFDHDAMIYGVHELPLTW